MLRKVPRKPVSALRVFLQSLTLEGGGSPTRSKEILRESPLHWPVEPVHTFP